jgi:hypothetical protein
VVWRVTAVLWLYAYDVRLYYMNAYVLYTVAFESRVPFELSCCSEETGDRGGGG